MLQPHTQRAVPTKKKSLGQYFTPPEVAEFMFKMVELFRGKKARKFAKVIDPACGEGVFVQYAFERNLAVSPRCIFGCDIDPAIRPRWKDFDPTGKLNLHICDGLLDDEEEGITKGSFDLVIGNPPYGGSGLMELGRLLETANTEAPPKEANVPTLFGSDVKVVEKRKTGSTVNGSPDFFAEKSNQELIRLANALLDDYESWKKENGKQKEDEPNGDLGFLGDEKYLPGNVKAKLMIERFEAFKHRHSMLRLSAADLKKLLTFPIEILFTERFVQLAKPGGIIAIIVPDGLLANANTLFFRRWMSTKGYLLAIVSLPRRVFSGAGANA
ncbi:MAG: N-6 DNA methylase, partial [candidate division Zixibacteria bacterium]|nr:N-6 DNA methylase [candidate division Zixibacteria bacterium]